MSTDYDIHCTTCGVLGPDWRDPTKEYLRCPNTNLDDFRDSGALLTALAHRADFDRLGWLFGAEMWRFSDNLGAFGRVALFFVAHVGHDLEVRSEYGDRVDS